MMMAYLALHPTAARSLPPIARVLAALGRDQLEDLISAAIDLLDASDPDSDLEADGDELDGDRDAEDEFTRHEPLGPGCPCADPDEAVDDRPIDDAGCGGSW